MGSDPTIKIKGKSGKSYTFHIYKRPVSFKSVGGVYLFTNVDGKGLHTYIYVGITEDLSSRFDNHHKIDCINKNRATHLSVFTEASSARRQEIEKDILGAISTTCNERPS